MRGPIRPGVPRPPNFLLTGGASIQGQGMRTLSVGALDRRCEAAGSGGNYTLTSSFCSEWGKTTSHLDTLFSQGYPDAGRCPRYTVDSSHTASDRPAHR